MLGISQSGNFPRVFSQGATSQMCNFPSDNFPSLYQPQRAAPQPILAASLGLNCSLRSLRGPNLTFRKLPLLKLNIWEVATWEIDTQEVTLGKMLLGKYLTTVNHITMCQGIHSSLSKSEYRLVTVTMKKVLELNTFKDRN